MGTSSEMNNKYCRMRKKSQNITMEIHGAAVTVKIVFTLSLSAGNLGKL